MGKIKAFLKVNLLIVVLLLSKPAFSDDFNNLTIFSEANMTYALTQISRSYSKKENIAISINFNNSFELIENIDLGEPADIFISSHLDWVKNLSQKGLVDRYSSLDFAKDKLVLITSNNNKKIDFEAINKIRDINKLLKLINDKRAPLIVGSENSSLGRYTKKIMDESGVDNIQIFKKLNEDKKSIINFINDHNDYCAIVMESEIKDDKDIVILGRIPFVKIDYHALVIAGNNMEGARKFIEYLKSKEARDILIENGFLPSYAKSHL
jgi:molybdate transport system substrate-binding protein